MHNCKATRETLIALALNGGQANQTQSLPDEVAQCTACLAEYASLANILRVAGETRESALPGDDFWPGYQARLRQRLANSATSELAARAAEAQPDFKTRLRDLFTSSVRIPVPVAAALLLFLGVSFAFAINARRRANPPAPIALTKTVAVPVIQEKPVDRPVDRIVTRIVYRDRDRRGRFSERNAIAAQRSTSAAEAPLNLIGFKPANEVNLTIIKGSQR
ncbi:MAG: hypothetical protein QOK48_2385 [Blastocatellia bacterium]|jgi:hypothetical protein|nr:hypothetical protein [Blastocatellia bacterium]